MWWLWYHSEPLKNPLCIVNISAQLFLKFFLLLQEFLICKCCFLTMLFYKYLKKLQSIDASSPASGNNVYMCVCVQRVQRLCSSGSDASGEARWLQGWWPHYRRGMAPELKDAKIGNVHQVRAKVQRIHYPVWKYTLSALKCQI